MIAEDERDDLVSAYYKRLISDDKQQQLEAARAWSIWEGSTSNLITKPSVLGHFADAHFYVIINCLKKHINCRIYLV